MVTAGTKIATGYWAAKRAGISAKGRWRAGGTLVARGEFSIVIAGLAVTAGVEPALGPLATAYVLVLVVIGPLTRPLHRAGRHPPDRAAWQVRRGGADGRGTSARGDAGAGGRRQRRTRVNDVRLT